jgi:DNA-binding transcriptional ArsR family regulator
MTKKLYEMQAELCKTLSNPKRLEILDILKEQQEISVNQLAERLEIPKANTSQHLAVLRQAGVVSTRKDGINVYYSLRSDKISEACALTRQILLERLEDHAGLTDLIRREV